MKCNLLKLPSDYEKNRANGQILVTLLMFVLIALTVISVTITTVISNSQSATSAQQGVSVYYVAEGGAENAMMRLLREPSYQGETLTIGDGSSTSAVNGSTITVIGTLGNFTKKLQIDISYTNNKLTVTSWREIP